MKLSIIIVSYNTAALTLQTVSSIDKSLQKKSPLKGNIEVIVVDNNSSDDSVSQLKELKKISTIPLKIVKNNTNVGFAAANNQGIALTKKSTVLLLNSDTIVQSGALEHMYQCLHHPSTKQLGIVAAQLLNTDGTFQPQGGDLPSLTTLAMHQLMIDDLPFIGHTFSSTQATGKNYHQNRSKEVIQFIGWVAGTAMMISRSTLDTIGVLDEHIFMYGEDIEYCIRAHNHGVDIAVCNQAQITHVQSASSSSERAILGEIKGYIFIWSKHKPQSQLPWLKRILKIGCALRILVFTIIKRNPVKVRTYQKAFHLI